MKKNWLLILCLMVTIVLTACGSKNGEIDTNNLSDENLAVSDGQGTIQNDNSKNFLGKSTLTVEDLDKIDETIFPSSYTYKVYQDGEESVVESGNFLYDEDSNLLVPEYEGVVDRRVISSNLEDGFIYTVSEITLEDGNKVIVSYANDPVSLKYLAVVVNEPNDTVKLYNFNY